MKSRKINTIIVIAEAKARITGHKKTKKLQNILHIFVVGYISQNHTVVIVTNHHHNVIAIEVKLDQTTFFSK